MKRFTGVGAQVGRGVGQVATGLVRVAEVAAVAIATAGAASVRATTSFQADMRLIQTQANASAAEVTTQTKAVQDLVHAVGTAPDELAKGLYHIESVGYRGAEALDILKASALGAKMGLSDMESMANALTAIGSQGSGIGGVKDMTSAMATLNAIVGVGNMRMQDLVSSFSTGILGTAKTFGVGLRELGSALAVLTDAGVPANVAATRLSMTFTHMAAPTAAAIKVFKTLGLGQFDLANDLRKPDGIFVALQDLHDHLAALGEINAAGKLTPQGAADVSKIFGGSRFGATAMQLLEQMDRVKLKYDQIGASQDSFAVKLQATMETAGFKWGQFVADLKESAIAFGEGVLPALARGLGHLDTFLVSHLGDIRQLGIDVGKGIDGIDWAGVERGANTFVGFLRDGFNIIKQIPPQIDLMVAGFLGMNKLSGGLLGAGLGNIVQGLGKGTANLILGGLSRLPGIGGAIGAVTATRVFVVNWPLGFGGAGPGGVAAAAEGGLGFFGKMFLIGEAIGLVDAVNNVRVAIADGVSAQATTTQDSLAQMLANHPTMDALQQALAGVNYGIDQLKSNPITNFLIGGDALPKLEQEQADILLAIQRLSGPIWRDHPLPTNADINGSVIWRDHSVLEDIAANTAASAASLGKLDKHLYDQAHNTVPAILAGIEARSAAKYGGTGLGKAAVEATFGRDMVRLGEKISTSGQTQAQKLDQLRTIETDLKNRGDVTAQRKIDRLITAVTNGTGGTTTAVNLLPGRLVHLVAGGIQFTGIPGAGSGTGSGGGTTTSGTGGSVTVPHQVGGIPLAEGGIVRRRPGGTLIRAGEGAHDEAVVPLDGRRGVADVRVDVVPQPIRLTIDGREVIRANLLAKAFVRA